MKSPLPRLSVALALLAMLTVSAQEDNTPESNSVFLHFVEAFPLIDGAESSLSLQEAKASNGGYLLVVGKKAVVTPAEVNVFAERVDAWLIVRGGKCVPCKERAVVLAGSSGGPFPEQAPQVAFRFGQKVPREDLAGLVISVGGKLHTFTVKN